MTFVLHWRRDGAPVAPALVDRLANGLTRLREEPVTSWSRGPLTVLAFEHSPSLSITESPACFVALLAGRLDDFSNLVSRLGGSSRFGDAPTDADVLAAAYERWGEQCFERLIGDFAAAIWEPREQSLLFARDVVGIAPLYYWSDPHEVVLAGHLGGVMAHPLVSTEPNEGYIAEILADDVHSRHETLYQDAWRLVAGHAARVDGSGSPRIRQWGRIEPREMSGRLPDEAYDELYRELLTQAITDRMRGPAKVGVELSGGLDSSSVAVLAAPFAQQMYGEPLQSYSLVFPGLPCDETAYIGALARPPSITPTLLVNQRPDADRLLRESRSTFELPGMPNGTPFQRLLSAAHAAGTSALLTGQGGDQWFYNLPNYPKYLAMRGHLFGAWGAMSQLSGSKSAAQPFVRHVMRPIAGLLARKVAPGLRPRHPPDWLTPGLVWRTNLSERLHYGDRQATSPLQERRRFCESGWEAFVYETAALRQQQVGGELRHPYYDSRLIRFALALNESHRWADRQSRAIQRRAMCGRLPDVIRTRTSKAEFSHLFLEQFDAAGGRRAFDYLGIARGRDWLVGSEMARMYGELEQDVECGRSPEHLWPLWLGLAVDSWHSAVTPR